MMITKDSVRDVLNRALEKNDIIGEPIEVEVPSKSENGDFSSNVAMKLARTLKKPPRTIAQMLVDAMIDDATHFERIEIAGPGFINFYVDKAVFRDVIRTILRKKSAYGNVNLGEDTRVNIEFVSVNPTGSLHIGHARGAAAGDALARIMKKAGYQVTKEFYVNDAGNQIDNLARSIDARYKALCGVEATIGDDGYHGPEIIDVAKAIHKEHGERFLEEDGLAYFKTYGVEVLLNQLQDDLEQFRVVFDVFTSEASLYESGAVSRVLEKLKTSSHTYEEDGALWLKTSNFGDEKDRVIVKKDGSYTYLLPDIAYHDHKFQRGFDQLINILGGDHHGYVDRLKASVAMLGYDKDKLDIDLLQMVKVLQDGEEIKMSKRSGRAITLSDLVEEVGVDPIRYFFAMRSLNTHMELDLDLALKQTNENPVYYAQYAHARIASVLRIAESRGLTPSDDASVDSLNGEKTDALLSVLAEYPSAVESAARLRGAHKITQYIHKLAQALHSFYAAEKVLTDDQEKTQARLSLLKAVKIVLKDSLMLVGVRAKERM